jgi:uncharacterized membrane protein YobD (UPF0266 family)
MAARAHHGKAASKRERTLNYALSIVIIVLVIYILYSQNVLQSLGIAKAQPLGNTTAGIDQQFSSSELSTINSAPNSNFETAGEMLLNGSLYGMVFYPNRTTAGAPVTPFMVNGKPSVIYVGAISCIYCGENRWAMALALSRFGKFGNLYIGYSSIGDGDVPTIYWSKLNYTTTAGVSYGNSYSSNYINFISAEFESPIKGGFQMAPLSYLVSRAPNQTYYSAMSLMNDTGRFQGTPFTLWGSVLAPGADAIVFGNTTPTSNNLPLTHMTHTQVLNQIASFNDQFAYAEYAAADVYASYVCPSINNSAPICALPAIKALIARENLTA